MTHEEIYKIAPYMEEHYKRCWVEGYIACLQAALKEIEDDQTLGDIAEKYAEKLDISRGWFDGGEIDDLIKESFQAGAKRQYQKDRGEFAKIKAKTWCEGFDAAISQFVKIPYEPRDWFSSKDGDFICGASFDEAIPAKVELYYRTKKED